MRVRGSRSAAVGGAVWLAALLVWREELLGLRLIDALLCFAALVLVPMGLSLRDPRGEAEPRLHRRARGAQTAAAILVLASFWPDPGTLASVLVLPWLGVSAALALTGLLSLRARDPRRPDELCLDAALLCLPVGAGWLAASRFGATPMGFGEPIVILTAVHFHYAGFTTMLLVGVTGRALHPESPVLLRPVALGALLGPPLLAAGITLSPALEAAAAGVVVLTLLGYSFLAGIVLRRRLGSAKCRVLLAVSAAAPLVSMAWAGRYAFLELLGRQEIGILEMARIHGVLNALGFGLCGLLAFRRATSAPGSGTKG